MNSAIKILSFLDKISIMAFIWCFAYVAYLKEYIILPIILFCVSWLLVLHLFKYYKNKAISNITMDIVIIILGLSGFMEHEDYLLLGVVVLFVALVDLLYIISLNITVAKSK